MLRSLLITASLTLAACQKETETSSGTEERSPKAHASEPPVASKPTAEPLYTRCFWTPPDLLQRLGGIVNEADDDPFGPKEPPKNLSIKEAFGRAGVSFPGKSSIYFQDGILTVTSTKESVELIAGIINADIDDSPTAAWVQLEFLPVNNDDVQRTQLPHKICFCINFSSDRVLYRKLEDGSQLGIAPSYPTQEGKVGLTVSNAKKDSVRMEFDHRSFSPQTKSTAISWRATASKPNSQAEATLKVTYTRVQPDARFWKPKSTALDLSSTSLQENKIAAYSTWCSAQFPASREEFSFLPFLHKAHGIGKQITTPASEALTTKASQAYSIDLEKLRNAIDLAPLLAKSAVPMENDEWAIFLPESQFTVVYGRPALHNYLSYLSKFFRTEYNLCAAKQKTIKLQLYEVSTEAWSKQHAAALTTLKPQQTLTSSVPPGEYRNYVKIGEWPDDQKLPTSNYASYSSEFHVGGFNQGTHYLHYSATFYSPKPSETNQGYFYHLRSATVTTADRPHYQILGQSADGKSHHILVTTTTFVDANGRSVFEPRTLEKR